MACRADDPMQKCSARRAAQVRRRFRWWSGHGWVWLDATHPNWTWERCPWCWGKLPDLDDHTIQTLEGYIANGFPEEAD